MALSSTPRKILRTMAALLVAGMLMVLLISDTLIKDEPVYSQGIQLSPSAITVNMRLLREDVFALLLTDIDTDAYPPIPRLMTLMVVKPGQVEFLALPANTRALVNHLDREGKVAGAAYAALADAFVLGDSCGRGMENLMEAVSQLMGGIPVERCIAVSSPGLMALADSIGGIPVSYGYPNVSAGALLGSGTSWGDAAVLPGSGIYAYATPNALVGLDTAALARQQELLIGFLYKSQAYRSADSLDWLRERTGDQLWISLSEQEIRTIESILQQADISAIPNTILWGEGRKIDDVDYLLPDHVQIKDYVLENFYE